MGLLCMALGIFIMCSVHFTRYLSRDSIVIIDPQIMATNHSKNHNSSTNLSKTWITSKNHSIQNSSWSILTTEPATTLIVFIHIPKTGGSSFKNALHDRITTPETKNCKYTHFFPGHSSLPWTHPGCGRKGQPMGIHYQVYKST